MNLKRILVPIDFSETSLAALGAAKVLAKRFESEVVLLHAVELLVPTDFVGSAATGITEAHEREAARSLARYEKELTRQGVRCRTRIVRNHPAQAILDVAKRLRVGLIVMGTHGAGAFRRVLVGSVADKILRMAPCPLLTVRSGKTARTRKGTGMRRAA